MLSLTLLTQEALRYVPMPAKLPVELLLLCRRCWRLTLLPLSWPSARTSLRHTKLHGCHPCLLRASACLGPCLMLPHWHCCTCHLPAAAHLHPTHTRLPRCPVPLTQTCTPSSTMHPSTAHWQAHCTTPAQTAVLPLTDLAMHSCTAHWQHSTQQTQHTSGAPQHHSPTWPGRLVCRTCGRAAA